MDKTARVTARQIASHLETKMGMNAAPQRLQEVIEAELQVEFGFTAIRAAEESERLTLPVRDSLVRTQQIEESAGVLSTLVVLDVHSVTIAGACRVLPGDDAEIVKLKRHRQHAEPLLQAIRDLSFDDFEKFGAKVLYLLGAKDVTVTRQSGDQGIDFFGVLNIGQLTNAVPAPFFKLVHDIELRFAGQAKHYASAIGPETIRELVGAISLARFKAYSNDDDIFSAFSLLPFNPLLGMVFTTGDFTDGARRLADRAGLIARSGRQLAAFLADCGIGISGPEKLFDKAAFLTWLNG